MHRLVATTAIAAAAALSVTACGSSTSSPKANGAIDTPPTTEAVGASNRSTPAPVTTATGAPTGPTLATSAPKPSPLPKVEVLDVATGKRVQFAKYLPSNKPLLVWFWAPH